MKKRYILTFPSETTNEPITYVLVKQYDIKINIIKANINSGEEGTLLLEMDSFEENISKAKKYLEENNISCQSLEKQIHFQSEECMHCGSCTAVCFANALTLDPETKKINFDTEKCIVCELCINACPLQLFESHFSE